MSELFGVGIGKETTLTELCNQLNEDLGFRASERIYPYHLSWWKRHNIVDFYSEKGSKWRSFTEEQYNRIKTVAFFHIKLGVKLSKIDEAIAYMNEIEQRV